MLHQRVFDQPISSNEEENFGDYDSQLGFFESIRAEHQSEDRPDSMAATLVWEALYDAKLVCDRTGFSSFGRNRNSAIQSHQTTVTEPNHLQNQLVSAEPASFGRKVAILAEMWLVLHKM